ncbi:MAG TPA: DUF5989 family protein [Pirellulales bacterium]|jgi:hypothetical protein|nr:DUF5989 family protein [Pirellulales bacterium]
MQDQKLESRAKPVDAPRVQARRRGWLGRLFGDILFVMKRDKKWWLLPLIITLLILAALLLLSAVVGPLAPFVYPLL